jgi:Ca-activated chloride channel family protein
MRRRRRFVAFSAVGWLRDLHVRPSPARRLPLALVGASLTFVVLALTEPVIPYSESEVHAMGLDIAVVLDLSSSMQEPMGITSSRQPLAFQPRSAQTFRLGKTRLETTKDAIRDFISRRRDDRIGLVVFSDHAYIVSPLTFDHASLSEYVDLVDEQILRGEGMTAIGDGIALANYLLVRQSTTDRRNKVVVVFTDGEHNYGRDPLEVLPESNAAGIRVHIIGVDIQEQVRAKPNVQKLIGSVRQYGGRYFSADTRLQLQAANAALETLEKGSLRTTSVTRNATVYQWFVLPALVLLAAALFLRAVPYFADFT